MMTAAKCLSDVILHTQKHIPKKTAADIDAEVKHIMTLQYQKTEQILTENMAVLTRVAENFLKRKLLTVKNLKNVLIYKKEETIMAQVTKKDSNR